MLGALSCATETVAALFSREKCILLDFFNTIEAKAGKTNCTGYTNAGRGREEIYASREVHMISRMQSQQLYGHHMTQLKFYVMHHRQTVSSISTSDHFNITVILWAVSGQI